MRTFGRSSTKNWAKWALKFGLLLTDAKLWADLNEKLRERADNASDVLRRRYEDTTEHLQRAGDALRGQRDWVPPVASFLGGVGLGLGVGMLFTPVSGEEARAALREKGADVKNKVTEATRFRSRSGGGATGTEGD